MHESKVKPKANKVCVVVLSYSRKKKEELQNHLQVISNSKTACIRIVIKIRSKQNYNISVLFDTNKNGHNGDIWLKQKPQHIRSENLFA